MIFPSPSGREMAVNFQNLVDHDETRTRNLLIRSQTPYPLGHAVGDNLRAQYMFQPQHSKLFHKHKDMRIFYAAKE